MQEGKKEASPGDSFAEVGREVEGKGTSLSPSVWMGKSVGRHEFNSKLNMRRHDLPLAESKNTEDTAFKTLRNSHVLGAYTALQVECCPGICWGWVGGNGRSQRCPSSGSSVCSAKQSQSKRQLQQMLRPETQNPCL